MESTFYAISSTFPFAVCLLWTCLLGDTARRKKAAALWMLAGFALTCTVLYFCHAVFFNDEETPWVRILYRGANLAVYPLFWLYVRSLSEAGLLPLRAYWVLLPSLAGMLLCGILYASDADCGWVEPLLSGVFLAEVVWVCFAGIRRLHAYDRRVENFYADTEGKSMEPLRRLLYLLVLTSAASALANFLGRSLFSDSLLLAVPSVLFSVLLCLIFYVGGRMDHTAQEVTALPESREEDDEPDSDEMQALLDRICALMESRQLFRTPGLKITDLATELGSNRTYISNCINRLKGESFSDFVNAYRVRYAQSLLLRNDGGKTIAQIGAEAGFTGDTSFFRNFKKITGQTPSAWLSDREMS